MVSNTSEPVADSAEIVAELHRVLQCRFLKDSQQLRALLRYVVEETLAGRQSGLKEYTLGREVFHRHEDYDPRNDAIVRVQASLLRKRLASYYEQEPGATLQIELPRGGYVPSFRRSLPVALSTVKAVEMVSPPPVPVRRPVPRWPVFLLGILSGALAAMLVFAVFTRSANRLPAGSPSLWGAFLDPKTETTISFGIPLFYVGGGGLYVRDTRVNRPGEEERGKIRWLSDLLRSPLRPQEDVYTGIGDVIGTHLITKWLDQRQVPTRLANSHYLGHSDIAGRNLVVVASARFQTLLQELDLPVAFRFDPDRDGGGYVLDQPLPGEQPFYRPASGTGVETSYATLTLWPGKKEQLRILYLSGVTTWATQGAAEYAIHPGRLTNLQHRLDEDPPGGPRGVKSPYFQVLLRVEGKNNQVRTANYLTHRYLNPATKLP